MIVMDGGMATLTLFMRLFGILRQNRLLYSHATTKNNSLAVNNLLNN
jgi:hypothetical protein